MWDEKCEFSNLKLPVLLTGGPSRKGSVNGNLNESRSVTQLRSPLKAGLFLFHVRAGSCMLAVPV